MIELSPRPNVRAPREIRLVLGEQVGGGYSAGEVRQIQPYRLIASDLGQTTFGPDLSFSPGYWCPGIEVLDRPRVGFGIELPGRLEVACGRLVIEGLPLRSEQVEPWVSTSEFGATLESSHPPAAEEWPRRFRELGIDVAWRVYGSPVSQEPPDRANYEGWFLQEPQQLSQSRGGLFFFACRERNGHVAVQLRSWNEGHSSEHLLKAAQRVMVTFNPRDAWCGNVQFSGAEWRRFVESGELPRSALGTEE